MRPKHSKSSSISSKIHHSSIRAALLLFGLIILGCLTTWPSSAHLTNVAKAAEELFSPSEGTQKNRSSQATNLGNSDQRKLFIDEVRWKKSSSSFLPNSPIQQNRASDDPVWQEIEETFFMKILSERVVVPQAYKTVRLNQTALMRVLERAPMEFTEQARSTQVTLSLPMPDGSFQSFIIEKSPVMEPELASKFPEIKTYQGRGLQNPSASVRLDWTPRGFHAIVLSDSNTIYIDPYSRSNILDYITYFKKDVVSDKSLNCAVESAQTTLGSINNGEASISSGGLLRVFRLAVGATGEYSLFQGGTVPLALSAITTTINRVNAIYQREAAIKLMLVANEDKIIFLDPQSDPYTNNRGDLMLDENQAAIDSRIGPANYDIGRLQYWRRRHCTFGGGLC